MGIFDFLFRNTDSSITEQIEEDRRKAVDRLNSLDSDFITYREEGSFERSMYGQLQELEDNLDEIEENLGEEGRRLRVQFSGIIQLLELSNNEDDPEVKKVFENFMQEYKKANTKSKGVSILNSLIDINSEMDEQFNKYGYIVRYYNGIDLIEEYSKKIQALQMEVDRNDSYGTPIQTGTIRQKFNMESLRAKYRLMTLKMMYLISHGMIEKDKSNPLKRLTPLEKKIFPKFFRDDLKRASEQYENLSAYEKVIEEYAESDKQRFRNFDGITKELRKEIETEEVKDKTFKRLFDGGRTPEELYRILQMLVDIKYRLNVIEGYLPYVLEKKEVANKKIQEELEKQRQEEIERVKEKERLRNATDIEIEDEIKRISQDLTSPGNAYINILDYQKRVAIEKGLLQTGNELIKAGKLRTRYISFGDACALLLGNEITGNYLIFPDSQGQGNRYIQVLASREICQKIDREIVSNISSSFTNKKKGYSYTELCMLSSKILMGSLLERLDSGAINFEGLNVSESQNGYLLSAISHQNGEIASYVYRTSGSEYTEAIRYEVRQSVEQLKQDIIERGKNKFLCYISFPTTRNMIPILEAFKEAGINPLFEAMPADPEDRNKINQDHIQIYFRRSDLEKYKKIVEDKISNSLRG